MEQLSLEIKNALIREGASLVGFADIRCIPPEARQSMDYAISIGVALNPAIIKNVVNGPTREYYYEFDRANRFLNYLTGFAAKLLCDRGYNSVAMLANDIKSVDQKTNSTSLPHKTVATRAGLGWIGKSALLVTEEYGPALRINSVLTDAVLECGTPFNASKCGECHECADACPVQAIHGNHWDVSRSRDDLLDVATCSKRFWENKKMLGLETLPGSVCGICMAACIKTRHYIAGR